MFILFLGAKLATVNARNETPLDLIFQLVQNPGAFLLNIFDQNIEKLSKMEENSFLRFHYHIFNPRSGGRRGERKVLIIQQ